jgi:hypothetical protein
VRRFTYWPDLGPLIWAGCFARYTAVVGDGHIAAKSCFTLLSGAALVQSLHEAVG